MEFFEKMYALQQASQPFVIATVVRAEKPTSAKPGAKAIITADNHLTGWIGGSCAEPTVKREAHKALEDGVARLLRLCPPEKMGQSPMEGVTEVTLTCISGGTLEIFIEPHLANPHLVVIGHLATAEALVQLGHDLGLRVTAMGLDASAERFPGADSVFDHLEFSQVVLKANTYVVVASHGNYDEEALEAALASEAGYVAILASKTRAQAMMQYLKDSGLSEERLARLKYPAGLDIGAVTPEEIALSILAEVIQHWRRGRMGQVPVEEPVQIQEAIDPVCGMVVEIETARYVSQYKGASYYFCSRGCQRSFDANPEEYLAQEGDHAV